MSQRPLWKVGVEVETLAAPGSTRGDVAQALAESVGGKARRVFQRQGERLGPDPSEPFRVLLPAFEVRGPSGVLVAKVVDDVTLIDDLDVHAAAQPDWYKVGSDDTRLVELVELHCSAETRGDQLLEPIAALFRAPIQRDAAGRTKVCARSGETVAATFPLRGEQERRSELVTAPLLADRDAVLRAHLAVLRDQGALVPAEGAIHLHFDAAPLCSAGALRALVDLWEDEGPALRERFRTNPRCRRLGPLQPELLQAIRAPGFAELPWSEVKRALLPLQPSKYRDLNLRNLIAGLSSKHTVEVRIFPVWLREDPLLEAISAVQDLLERAIARA